MKTIALLQFFITVMLASFHCATANAAANQVGAFNSTSYTSCAADGWGDMNNSKAAADGFMTLILQGSGSVTWTAGLRVSDSSGPVMGKWLAANYWGDTYNDDFNSTKGFDYSPGINLYQGHGWGSGGSDKAWRDGKGGSTHQACTPSNPSSSCNTPPAGDSGSPTFTPAVCLKQPVRSPCPAGETCSNGTSYTTPWCAYTYRHAIQTCASTETQSRRRVDYSSGSSEIHLGEGGNGQPWTFPNTAGNTQMAVILISHASHLGSFGHDLAGIFGGLDAVATVYTMGGDYADDASRAGYFGSLIKDYPNSALYYLWMSAGSYTTSGGGCPGWKLDSTPHQGFNGCGGHVFMAMDITQSAANSKVQSLTPADLQNTNVRPGTGAAGGNGYRAVVYNGNWDLLTYPALLSSPNF